MNYTVYLCWTPQGQYFFITKTEGGVLPTGTIYAKNSFDIEDVGDIATKSGYTIRDFYKLPGRSESFLHEQTWLEALEDSLLLQPNKHDYRLSRMQFAAHCLFPSVDEEEFTDDSASASLSKRAELSMMQHAVYQGLSRLGKSIDEHGLVSVLTTELKLPRFVWPVCTPQTEEYMLANYEKIVGNSKASAGVPITAHISTKKSDHSKLGDTIIVITCILLLVFIMIVIVILLLAPPYTI